MEKPVESQYPSNSPPDSTEIRLPFVEISAHSALLQFSIGILVSSLVFPWMIYEFSTKPLVSCRYSYSIGSH